MFKNLLAKLKKKAIRAYRSGRSTHTALFVETDETLSMWGESEYTTYATSDAIKATKNKDERIVKKPVEVFKEIISEEPKININKNDIKKQIQLVKKRMEFMEYQLDITNLPDEKSALRFLKARLKYDKYKNLFRWSIATFSAVKKLCDKYKVIEVSFNNFYKTVPMEAIEELEQYLKAYKKIRKNKPVLKLIIDQGGKEDKKDPILLAGSPFGKWWYIIGAWDKEVAIVDDLIYKGK